MCYYGVGNSYKISELKNFKDYCKRYHIGGGELNELTIHAMGTIICFSIKHKHANMLLAQAEQKVFEWEKKFSANNNQSDLMKINSKAGKSRVKVDSELFKMIQIGQNASISSSQKMNILIGPLVKLWKIGFNNANKPEDEIIKKMLNLINPQDLELNEKTNEVYLKKEGMEIDLGALVKGYFADEIKRMFIDEGVRSGIINFGGNVITIGNNVANNDYWYVGIRDPFDDNGKSKALIKIKNQSVVTSGIYERYFIKDHCLYHHILDSKTGYPVNNDIASVTIVSNYSIDGEIWSTICSFGNAKQNIELLNQIDGLEGLIIKRNGEIEVTDKLYGLVKYAK